MGNSDWVTVYSTSKLFEAELVQSILTENEIECVLINKQDSSYLFGEIEVCVPTEDAFSAKQLILGNFSE